jgi:hypothetical protein
MAKNISRLLQKGNLTPKERHFLRVANLVSKEKTGKTILTEADEYALIDGWQPTNNDEVREFNRYNQAWKTAIFAESDAQTVYLETKLKYQDVRVLLNDFIFNPFYSEVKRALDELETIKRVDAKEAIDIINRQREVKLKRGQDINNVIYRLAFELTDKNTKKKLLELYEDTQFDSQYLDEEQELADLYRKKDFEGIAERVAKIGFDLYLNKDLINLYYACIPIKEIAERYAKENNIPFEECILSDEYKELDEYSRRKELKEKHPEAYKKYYDEDEEIPTLPENNKTQEELKTTEKLTEALEKHAQENKTTLQEIIKTACLKWIGEGLLDKDHIPIVIAEPELLNKWIKIKKKAHLTLKGLIDNGTLKTDKASESGVFMTSGEEIITGESLYNSGLDYAFVEKFKAYVDEYLPNLGIVEDDKDKGERVDRELLIVDKKFFSRYEYLLSKVRSVLGLLSIVSEEDKDHEIIVDVKSKGLKALLIDVRDDFVKNYELFLGFEEFFKCLSTAYDMDVSYRVAIWATNLKSLVESFNNTLLDALETKLPYSTEKKKHYKSDELFIDTKKIKPNRERVEPAFRELSEVFGDAFNG